MRTSKGCLFRACYSKGVSQYNLCVSEIQRQTIGWESLIVGKKKKEGFRYALTGGFWCGSAAVGPRRSGPSMGLVEHIMSFLQLVLSWKWTQKLGKLSIANQVMAVSEPVVLQAISFWPPELTTSDGSQKWSDLLQVWFVASRLVSWEGFCRS